MVPTVDPATIGFSASLHDYLFAASSVGFQAAEFSIERAMHEWGEHPEQLVSLATHWQITLAQFTCGLGIPSNICIPTQKYLQGLVSWRTSCAFAAQLGCHRASILAHGTKGSTLAPEGVQLDVGDFQQRLARICTIAQEYAIDVSVELIDPPLFHDAKAILKALHHQGINNLGLLLDTYGLHATTDPLAYLTDIIDYVTWVHIADANFDQVSILGKPTRGLPGHGQLPLRAMLELLQNHGYTENVSVEVYADQIFAGTTYQCRAALAAESLLRPLSLHSFFISGGK